MVEDRELIKRTLAGEREAFDELVARYQDGLYRHLLRLTSRPEEAEDLSQEAFIAFYRNLRRFNPARPVAPFLFAIATNAWKMRLRRPDRETEMPGESAPAEGDSVSEQVLSRLEHQQVLTAVAQLQPEQKEAVSLFYDQGLSYREISRVTGAPVGTVSTRLKRALENLRQVLAAGGAGLVMPGVGDLPQYLTSVLQGQATAPGSIGPAVAQGIAGLAPAGAGALTLFKGALVMKKAIYVAIGLAVVGGAVVGVPRLMNQNSALPAVRVEEAKQKLNPPVKEIGITGEYVEIENGQTRESGKIYNQGAKSRKEPYHTDKVVICRRDKGVIWILNPADKTYQEIPRGSAGAGAYDIDAAVQGAGLGQYPFTKALVGQEEINGYLCDKYSLAFGGSDAPVDTMSVWFAKKLGQVIWLKVETGKLSGEGGFRNIKVVDLPDSLFEIPEGYAREGGGAPVGALDKATGLVADMTTTHKDGLTESVKFYNKGEKSRIEQPKTHSVSIWRRDKNVIWLADTEEKAYYELTLVDHPVAKAVGQFNNLNIDTFMAALGVTGDYTKTYLGKETVNGYLCEKYSIKAANKGDKFGTVLAWWSKPLDMIIRIETPTGNNNMMQTNFSNIHGADLPDSLFELPKGYKLLERQAGPVLREKVPDKQ